MDQIGSLAEAEAEDAQVSAWRSGRPKEKELTIDSRTEPRFGTWEF